MEARDEITWRGTIQPDDRYKKAGAPKKQVDDKGEGVTPLRKEAWELNSYHVYIFHIGPYVDTLTMLFYLVTYYIYSWGWDPILQM